MPSVTYGRVDEVLRSLGFSARTAEDARVYKHEPTGALIVLPNFSDSDEVLPRHLVAVRLTLDSSQTCSRIAVGITGVADKAYRAERVEKALAGKKLDLKAIEQAAAESTYNIDVIEDINGSAEYRTHLTHVYVTRAIEAAMNG